MPHPAPTATTSQLAVDGDPWGIVALPATDTFAVAVGVSGGAGSGSVEDVRYAAGHLEVQHRLVMSGVPHLNGVAMSPDGKWIAVTAGYETLLAPTDAVVGSGHETPLSLADGSSTALAATFSSDGREVFVANESDESISVFPTPSGETTPKAVGEIRLNGEPVDVTLDPSGDMLYVVGFDPSTGAGEMWILSATLAATASQDSVVKSFSADCDWVRVAVAPATNMVWVTGQGSNSLLGFDAASLPTKGWAALKVRVRLGANPTGLAVYDGGRYAVVTNSGRFASTANSAQTVVIVDLLAAEGGRPAALHWIGVGVFPRDVAVSDGVGMVTNYASGTVTAFSIL